MRHHHFARQYLSLQLWFSNKVWLNFWLRQLKIVFQLKGCLLFGEIMVDLSRTFSEQGRKIWSDFRAYQIWFLPRESCDISSKESLYLQWWTAPCLIDSWFRTERFGCQRSTLHKSIFALLLKGISSERVRIFLSMYYITTVFLKARFQCNLQRGKLEWH